MTPLRFRDVFGIGWTRFMKFFLLGYAFVVGLLSLLYFLVPRMVF